MGRRRHKVHISEVGPDGPPSYRCNHEMTGGFLCTRHTWSDAKRCWQHRPRRQAAVQAEKRARLERKLLGADATEAAKAARAAREAYEKGTEELLDQVFELEAVLPKKLREKIAKVRQAAGVSCEADEHLGRLNAAYMDAADAYRKACDAS